MDEIDEKFNKLKKWFIQNGGYIRDSIIRKKTEKGYYGLFTTEKLESDTIIIKTPQNLCLNILDNVKNIEEEEDYIKRLLSLLIELNKGHESFFYNCFELLPSLEEFKSYSIMLCNEDITNKLKILGFDLKKTEYDISNYKKIYEKIILINEKNKYIENLDSNNITYAILIHNHYYWENGLDPIMLFINHKKDNSLKIMENNINVMKINKIVYENCEIFLSYSHKKSEELAFSYDFIDMENFDISLSIYYTANDALDFYKAKLLMDIGLKSRLNEQKLSVFNEGIFNISNNSIIVSKNNLDQLFKVASILSIKKIGDIDNTNVVDIYKMSKKILELNLSTINIENPDYLDEIKKQYPHIGILIEEKYNLIQKMINHINNLLVDYINT